MKRPKFFLFLLGIMAFNTASGLNYEQRTFETTIKKLNNNPWKLEKEADGIKIYTRHIEGWDIKEYKAVFYVKATLKAVENALRDTPNQKKWSKNTISSKEIKNISRNNFYTYSQSDSPWPASDRDNVVHIKYSYPQRGEIHIKINSEPDKHPRDANFVRVERMQGIWKLQETKSGLIKITQQAVVDPGGSAPVWLINSFLVSGPHKNMKNLKQYIEKNAAALARL